MYRDIIIISSLPFFYASQGACYYDNESCRSTVAYHHSNLFVNHPPIGRTVRRPSWILLVLAMFPMQLAPGDVTGWEWDWQDWGLKLKVGH